MAETKWSSFFHYGAPIITVLFCLPHETMMIYGLSSSMSPFFRTLECVLVAGVGVFALITIMAWGVTGLRWSRDWLFPRPPSAAPRAKSRALVEAVALSAYGQGVTARLGDIRHYSTELATALESISEALQHNETQTRITKWPLNPELISPAEIAQDRERIEHAEDRLGASLTEFRAFLSVPQADG